MDKERLGELTNQELKNRGFIMQYGAQEGCWYKHKDNGIELNDIENYNRCYPDNLATAIYYAR